MKELSIEQKAKAYDGYMDKECIELCDKLNSLSHIETTESCCGHCKNPYMIFFNCYDFIRLGKLYRCVNKNYSDGKWRIECCCSDGSPVYGFLLTSKEPFNSKEEMMESVKELIENIDYWEDSRFDNYFKNGIDVDRKLLWVCPIPCVRKYLEEHCGYKTRWYHKLFWKGKKHF